MHLYSCAATIKNAALLQELRFFLTHPVYFIDGTKNSNNCRQSTIDNIM